MTATGDRKLVTFGIVTTVVAILMVFAINVRRGQLDGEIPTNGRESHIFDDIYDDVLGILADASDAALPSSAAASTKARSKGSKARSKSVGRFERRPPRSALPGIGRPQLPAELADGLLDHTAIEVYNS